jgi:hypothetical protein
VERLDVETGGSRLSAGGSLRDYTGAPTFDLRMSAERLDAAELSAVVPALDRLRVSPALDVKARGPLEALATRIDLRSQAGVVTADVVADGAGPVRGLEGRVSAEHVDLGVVFAGAERSRVTATADLDLDVDERGVPTGRATIAVSPSSFGGVAIEALEARAALEDGRANLDANARAYGARASARGVVSLPVRQRWRGASRRSTSAGCRARLARRRSRPGSRAGTTSK